MDHKIALIGLGYVGLPLAVAFSKKFDVLGYDQHSPRVNELNQGIDRLDQLSSSDLKQVELRIIFSDNPDLLSDYNTFIITVPTPVTADKKPDLSFLINASKTVGNHLKKGDLVIYESTVYPGCTEEDCVPVLEGASGLKFNTDFYCGYSPERINPGDKVNTLTQIKKVTSGSTPEVAERVDVLYQSIIEVGTHKAPSIRVAEAAKAVENAQRDLNISFVNELALIFDRMQIDTHHVLEAAATKWNFLNFKPGLVGGHCISVDPYFLTHKATQLGYNPEVILSGRNVNDSIPQFVAVKVVDLMQQKGVLNKDAKALIMGITFKENFNDIRNSKVPEIYKALKNKGLKVDVYDPMANPDLVKKEYGISLIKRPGVYEAIILAVSHQEFIEKGIFQYKKHQKAVIFDIKSVLPVNQVDGRL
uniref:Nucleotide-sugar dehydrogenase n=1 Tax=uncultured Flavobacteriia bacterium TaxID=212695 RepID=H6REP1_9BACT|nr:nucleotide-sugar dehydrogenase [uncultured bacterium]CCF99502.1 nucleotide-sugar dehydrogenase [uncultured Flavobacteriia bacterium]